MSLSWWLAADWLEAEALYHSRRKHIFPYSWREESNLRVQGGTFKSCVSAKLYPREILRVIEQNSRLKPWVLHPGSLWDISLGLWRLLSSCSLSCLKDTKSSPPDASGPGSAGTPSIPEPVRGRGVLSGRADHLLKRKQQKFSCLAW